MRAATAASPAISLTTNHACSASLQRWRAGPDQTGRRGDGSWPKPCIVGLGAALAHRLPLPVRHGRTKARAVTTVESLWHPKPPRSPNPCRHAPTIAIKICCCKTLPERVQFLIGVEEMRQRGKGRMDTLNRPGAGIYSGCEGSLQASRKPFTGQAVFFLGCLI